MKLMRVLIIIGVLGFWVGNIAQSPDQCNGTEDVYWLKVVEDQTSGAGYVVFSVFQGSTVIVGGFESDGSPKADYWYALLMESYRNSGTSCVDIEFDGTIPTPHGTVAKVKSIVYDNK